MKREIPQTDLYEYCQRCGKKLNPKRIVWLEYDQRTGTYAEPCSVPEEFSQGCFPFGPDCAPVAKQEHEVSKIELIEGTPIA